MKPTGSAMGLRTIMFGAPSPELRLALTRRLEAYLARPAERGFGDVPEAAQLGAFPLMYDLRALDLLRLDGALFVDESPPSEDGVRELREVPEGPERWTALSVAAREERPGLAELRELLPERPAGTPDRARCGGRGFEDWPTADGGTHAFPCPACASLGWVHRALTSRASG